MNIRNSVIRTLIIDDETAFINTMQVLLKDQNDFEIIGSARSVEEGVQLINAKEPNLIFLDVEMEDGTGFDLLKRIDRNDFKVIFVTAFDHYAIEAFRYSAIDYLLKPVVSDDLHSALAKVKVSFDLHKTNTQLAILMENIYQLSNEKRKIVLKEFDTHHVFQIDEILCCQAEGSYTRFFLTNRDPLLVSRNLKEFEIMLNNASFFRAHRSHLVNLNKVRKFEKSEGSVLYLEGGYAVPVSVRKRERLAVLLSQL